MISSLRGVVSHVGLTSAVIDVHGLGMLVQATPQTLAALRTGSEAFVHTAMIVREDSMTLYGFTDADQREVFEILLGVSGVGPRIALAVLAVHTPEAIRVAASSGDDKAFSKVSGIGPKGARRIVLELADKLVPHGTVENPAAPRWQEQVLAAMTGLGWSEKDATAAIEDTAAEHPDIAAAGNVGEILKLTLRRLGTDGARTSPRRKVG
ncbi:MULTISPECIES: Holliday junction branch migration protein RuvA [unclassified Arthrobacter]|uniref:Holliday junction branch migration protein RuvA n=1 Tax=unclassified Arthrobacter TaxID=235627 RepID=UPI001E35F8A7|nr:MULTISPECIES: Holliday junction branch migration protein RuvA [unclassified Arthrobacter]MCC9145562.1 Holliday junction branch migration protein RuvA [Arthrobacter sp. zg-Y919]MDK1276791.1 Holliday junction branch migration protein RuvA [Arthrobacter sp. zg.Y919]WIB04269.1 Holliday junction branch migration protein RuvA [Arthrobacter sp. zg-Y919]